MIPQIAMHYLKFRVVYGVRSIGLRLNHLTPGALFWPVYYVSVPPTKNELSDEPSLVLGCKGDCAVLHSERASILRMPFRPGCVGRSSPICLQDSMHRPIPNVAPRVRPSGG